jgi:hypothetical protein
MVRPAPFRERADSVRPGDLRGPFDGQVIDAETGRPIPDAQVLASWTFVEGYALLAPAAWREHIVVTDATGRYQIPRLAEVPRGGSARLGDFHLVVYKRGYIAWRSDRRFEDFGPRADFAQRKQEVRLERWRSDISHVRHLRYLGGGPTLQALTKWEVAEAAAELSGVKPEDRPVPPTVALLDATPFLLPDDVKQVTGYQGEFEVRKLNDEPTSTEYDSVHLRAKGAKESFDVAARVWKLDVGEAQAHYGRLVAELPNVKETNEVGDRSLRATQQDILGAAFLDGRRGYVVMVQCGNSLCPTHEKVVGIARRIKDRIDQQATGGQP